MIDTIFLTKPIKESSDYLNIDKSKKINDILFNTDKIIEKLNIDYLKKKYTFQFYLERMYIKDIGKLINRKDSRSVERWCKQNHLNIYKDSSGRFTYKNDFDLIYDMPLIHELKKKYKDGWKDYYEKYNKDDLISLIDSESESKSKKSNYQPKGKISKKISKK